ncbi:iron ABC transporter permease [Domibacillus sp. PGB-M46]|uniref:ABC transporter permease n=1 Tax=Domibacillus sp. PGB-M46 TaxID=2910255 RepID=UPI001F5743D9|nr:iron ABC transporter permease [Domibacillus sp. PGB-M46]MCI2252786.1 iron ABC transporter permease [Domibacillus sp. PGB-M46]
MISPQSAAPERRREAPSFSSFFGTKKWLMVLGLLLVVCVFVVPVFRLLLLSVLDKGAWSSAHYESIWKETATWTAVRNTLYTTAGSTILSLVLGVSMAWIMAYVHLRGKRWMQLFIFLPFIIPSYITTLAWIQFLGKSGPVFSLFGWAPNLYSMGGIIFLLGVSHYPLVYLFTVDVFRKIPRELEDAARTSGAGRKHVLLKVVLPLALPGIAGGGLLAFLTNLDNFGIPAFLGIPANIRVLSTYIYEQIAGFGPSSFARAAVLSVLLGAIALAGTFLQWLLLKKSRVTETVVRDTNPRIYLAPRPQQLLEAGIWLFLGVTSLVPFLAMGALSLIKAYGLPFRPENLSLENYYYVFLEDAKTGSALWNSVWLAVFTMGICLVAGTALAYLRYRGDSFLAKWMELFVTVPYALPGTVLALCMIFAWMQPIPGWNPGLYGSVWILLIAYVTRFFVLQVRGSYTALLQVDPSMEEAAKVSGAYGWVKWRRILLPLLFPGLAGGALLVFLMVLTELTVSSLLWSTGSETIGVVIFNYEQAGYTTYSTAFASVLVLAILAGGLLFTALSRQWERKVMKKQ